MLKIAISYAKDRVDRNFNECKQFMFCNVEYDMSISIRTFNFNLDNRKKVYDFLTSNEIDVLICGKINDNELQIINNLGISVYNNEDCEITEAIKRFLNDELLLNGKFKHKIVNLNEIKKSDK